ncbi:MAG TPA: glycosyltransferase [Candidatus Saccharimonadales bacterium]|nr:glycosyltransferase [Candidatus Saccharimonadales bacterium]
MSLARALRQQSKGCRIVYIGLKGESLAGDLKDRFKVFDEVYTVPAGKFRRYHGESLLAHLADVRTIALNVRDLFRVFAGIGHSQKLLRRIMPDVVFSKGGYVAVPVGLAAVLLRIPIVTHDSDTVPGLANRIIGRFARLHATGMPADYYSYANQTIRYTGIPLDERIRRVDARLQAEYKKKLGFEPGNLVLLAGGAGLGAKTINDLVINAAPDLLESFKQLEIVHIAGQQHLGTVTTEYKSLPKDVSSRIKILGFTPDFYLYSGAADVIITRAGATTIAELAAQSKAVVLVPAPHLTGGHQLKNAEELRKMQAAVIVDNNATPQELAAAVSALLGDKGSRQKLAANLAKLAKPEAAAKLAALLLQEAKPEIAEHDAKP